jgi:hypothetical protein
MQQKIGRAGSSLGSFSNGELGLVWVGQQITCREILSITCFAARVRVTTNWVRLAHP